MFTLSLQNDEVQDFDVRWDHALSSVSEMPSDPILEGLYKSKLQNSVQVLTVMALYDQEVSRNNGTPNYQQLKTAVKLHNDEMMRNRNFRVRIDVVERGSVTKSRKGNNAHVGRKIRVFSVESTRTMFQKETHAVSVMTPKPVETRAKARDEKDDRLLPHPIRRQSGPTARNINPHRDQGINRKTRETRVKFHADSNYVKIRRDNSSMGSGKKKKNKSKTGGGQGDGVPKAGVNRRRRTREGPEPACVQAPFFVLGWHTQGGKGELTSCRGTV